MKKGLLLLMSTALYAVSLPPGWKAVTSSEEKWRDRNPAKFLSVKGDFDGDGVIDSAVIARSEKSHQFATIAFLSSPHAPLILEKFSELTRQGITVIKPGKYKTACGKGYGDWACAHGEPEVLLLNTDAIDSFEEGSAEAFFYWNPKQRQFVRVQMSD